MAEPIRFDDGAAYEQAVGIWSSYAGEIFVNWLNPAPRLRWLDVGCGSGAFTEQILRHCAPAEVLGIDPSEGQLAFARTRCSGPNVTFRQGDAMALPVDANSYDVAVLALVIYFVPDPAKSIAEMRRAVRPGGTVCTYMWDGPAGGSPTFPMQQALRSLGYSPTLPPSIAASTMESLQGLWHTEGLQDVRTRTIEVRRSYDSFDACWAAMALQPIARPIIARMTEAERTALQARLRDFLPAPDAQGRWSYGAHANAITGRVPT